MFNFLFYSFLLDFLNYWFYWRKFLFASKIFQSWIEKLFPIQMQNIYSNQRLHIMKVWREKDQIYKVKGEVWWDNFTLLYLARCLKLLNVVINKIFQQRWTCHVLLRVHLPAQLEVTSSLFMTYLAPSLYLKLLLRP